MKKGRKRFHFQHLLVWIVRRSHQMRWIPSDLDQMASKILFPPAEEDAVIRERFLTGAAVGRGEPPFKKLIKR